jgi:hypothetical protein
MNKELTVIKYILHSILCGKNNHLVVYGDWMHHGNTIVFLHKSLNFYIEISRKFINININKDCEYPIAPNDGKFSSMKAKLKKYLLSNGDNFTLTNKITVDNKEIVFRKYINEDDIIDVLYFINDNITIVIPEPYILFKNIPTTQLKNNSESESNSDFEAAATPTTEDE